MKNTLSTFKPLFSVCTEITNRENTIIRTIDSIRKQRYTNYEYIIVDNASNDKSVSLILNFLNKYNEFAKRVTFIQNKTRVRDIESWNSPIRLAKGKYIVVCEGDDFFLDDHLEKIQSIIYNFPNIGIIVSPNESLDEGAYSEYLGKNSSNKIFKALINFNFCPPPSETIFLREFNNQKFLYDQENFVYAGEYSLYEKILQNGLDIYVEKTNTVHRGVKQKPLIKKFIHLQDSYFCFFKKWQNIYEKNESIDIRKKLLLNVTNILSQQIIWLDIEKKTFKFFLKECFMTRSFPLKKLCKYIYVNFKVRIKFLIKGI